ncbi:hypothetical protein [Kitasatospora kifunensis]
MLATDSDSVRATTVFDDGQALSQFHQVSSFDPVDMWWWRRHPQSWQRKGQPDAIGPHPGTSKHKFVPIRRH